MPRLEAATFGIGNLNDTHPVGTRRRAHGGTDLSSGRASKERVGPEGGGWLLVLDPMILEELQQLLMETAITYSEGQREAMSSASRC